jgi:hypothetical protein
MDTGLDDGYENKTSSGPWNDEREYLHAMFLKMKEIMESMKGLEKSPDEWKKKQPELENLCVEMMNYLAVIRNKEQGNKGDLLKNYTRNAEAA